MSTITYDNSVYIGEVKKDDETGDILAHGKGIMNWSNGSIYDGDWVADNRSGKGVFTWPNGDRYEGNWKDDCRSGLGVITWMNGASFKGMFRDGKRHGKGIDIKADGTVTEGVWRDGVLILWHPNSTGRSLDSTPREEPEPVPDRDTYSKYIRIDDIYKYDDTDSFTYYTNNVMRRADGTLSTKSDASMRDQSSKQIEKNITITYPKSIYTGDVYMNNNTKLYIPHGTGVMRWTGGCIYEGEWRDGKQHGYGIYMSINGDIYDGNWKYDKMDGYGIYKKSNGDIYTGQFSDSHPHGKGTWRFINGSINSGDYVNGFLLANYNRRIYNIRALYNILDLFRYV